MHPYDNFPEESFWKRSVTDCLWSDMNFKPTTKFKLDSRSRIATAGSCFAQHIARHLEGFGLRHSIIEEPPPFMLPQRAAELQYGVFSARYGNIYTARQLRQLIEFAFGLRENITLSHQDRTGWVDLLRPGVQAEGYESQNDLEGDRAWHLACVRRLFLEVDCFIFTLGLTEAWYHEPSDVVFPVCPGTRSGIFNSFEHKFINFRFSQVVEDLNWCIDFLQQQNSNLKWIFTVSPVALAATATHNHVVVATAASKAILRAAADEVCNSHTQCDYFPSFEIVNSAATFGQFLDSDLRSISPRGVKLVMQTFQQTFVLDGAHHSLKSSGEPVNDKLNVPKRVDFDAIKAQISAAVKNSCDESFHDPRA